MAQSRESEEYIIVMEVFLKVKYHLDASMAMEDILIPMEHIFWDSFIQIILQKECFIFKMENSKSILIINN